MLVTVLINNYNYGRFLRECIESALHQTYSPTEVVVVDDGSTDESRQVIAGYGNRLISVFKENGGQASAYNAGLAASHGDAVCFLDSDDTLYPDALERAVNRYHSHELAAKVQWPLRLTDADGRPTGKLSTKCRPPEGDLKDMIIRDGPFYDADLTTGALYPRWMLEHIFPVPEPPYRNGADVYAVTLAPIFGPVHNIAEPLGTYRVHGSNNYRGRRLDDERIRDYIRRFETNCDALGKHLRKLNLPVDPAQWRRRNVNYLWPCRLLAARIDVANIVPEGSTYILVDDLEWGGGEPLAGRHSLPFLERAGEYWGPPADDDLAIAELERLRQEQNAGYLVFWWTAFWWLSEYSYFVSHLRRRYRQVLQNDHILAFDLSPGTAKQELPC